MALLEVKELSINFGGLLALDNISFEIDKGQITSIIGPNGAGKTTVFNCLTGFYSVSSGKILVNLDKKTFHLERMRGDQIARDARIARTFQNIRLFSQMTLLENLLVAQHKTLMRASGWSLSGLLGLSSWKKAEAEAIQLAEEWLYKVALIDRANDVAESLSYGEQRRLEIARAMCTKPVVLCLDEPAAGLNPRESAQLNCLISEIKNETSIGIILIEHDMNVVMEISDQVIVLNYGCKIASGTPSEIKINPRVIEAYLGEPDPETGGRISD